jgi:YD repeat-containing protein
VNDGRSASGGAAATVTKTYKDPATGRSFTVYDDGSYTETIAGAVDRPIVLSDGSTSIDQPSIPAGGSETVSFPQRAGTDTSIGVYTIDVSDAAGTLVDVYEPAVTVGTGTVPVVPHTHYDYNANGNEIDQIDANAEASSNPATGETEWTYDQNGDELSRTLPDGEEEHYTYNIYNQVATHVDFDGNTATYSYYSDFDAGDYTGSLQQVQSTAPAGSGKTDEAVGYTYDSLGRQATVSNSTEDTSTDPATGKTTNSYDSQGNLIEQDTPEGSITYGFNQTTGQLANASTGYTLTSYIYNMQGQLTSVSVQTRTTLAVPWSSPSTTTYTYDGDGNKATETLPNGDKTTYTYDDLDRLIRQTTANASGGSLFIETLVLNPNGTRASATETQVQPGGSTSTLNYAWGYDADQRLSSESLNATSSSTADGATVANMDYSDAYTFDLDGNRLTDKKTGTGDGPAGETDYAYNRDDQLMNTGSGGVVNTTYTYDPNGSQTSMNASGTVTTYTFDVRNKMVGYQSGTNTASYIYDDAGNRVQETTNGTATFYLTDTQNPTGYVQPIEQRSSQTAAPSMTYMVADRVFGQVNASSGITSYLLTDGHGSTIALTSSAGAPSAVYTYSAYGTALNFNAPSAGMVFLFGGDAAYDPVTGQYLHGDGTRGVVGPRFIEADTAGNGARSDPISLSRYLYAADAPLTFLDPSGHEGLASLSFALGIVAIVLSFPNFANAPTPGGARYPDISGQMGLAAVMSAAIAPPVSKLLGYAGGFISSLFTEAASAQGAQIFRILASDEVDQVIADKATFGDGTVYSHFTTAENLANITGLPLADVESLEIGQSAVLDNGTAVFKPGVQSATGSPGAVFATDLPASASADQLTNLGIRSSNRSYVIQFSEQTATKDVAFGGPKFVLKTGNPVTGSIYSADIPEGTTYPIQGSILISRVR